MDPLTMTLISIGIKEVLPTIISLMRQSGMTEAEINAEWEKAYTKFKTEDPNLLPN